MGISKQTSSVILTVTVLVFNFHTSIALPMNISTASSQNFDNSIHTSKPDHSVGSRYRPKKCEAGVMYNITYLQDLYDKKDELECIFHAGISSSKLPEGPMYGGLLDVCTYSFMTPVVPYLWKGKLIEKFNCNGNDVYRGWNVLLGQPVIPFVARIAKISDAVKFHPMEKHTDKETVIIDYTKHVYDSCPNLDPIIKKTKDKVIVQQSSKRNFYPINQFVDVIVFVGRQPDGGAIYLGKAYGVDAFASDNYAKSIGVFYLVNYDQAVNPEFKSGDALPPTEQSFYYRITGITELLLLILPHDNFLSEPIHCAKRMFKETIPFCRGVIDLLIEVILGLLGMGGSDARRINQSLIDNLPLNYTKIRPDYGSDKSLKTAYYLSHYNLAHSHFNEL